MSAAITAFEMRKAMANRRRRLPSGERMRQFRWGPTGDAVLTWPAALISTDGLTPVGHQSRWTVPAFPENRDAFCYWLAHAVRQDLWRRAKNVRGLMPIVRVRPIDRDEKTGKPAVAVLAGAFLPSDRGATAVDAMLADLFQPNRMAHWTDWARRKTRDPAGTPDAGGPEQQARDEA